MGSTRKPAKATAKTPKKTAVKKVGAAQKPKIPSARKATAASPPRAPQPPAADEPQTMSLDELQRKLGPASGELRKALLAHCPDAEAHALGARVDSPKILLDGPGFVLSAWRVYQSLNDDERKLLPGFSPALLPILVTELVLLEQMSRTRVSKGAGAKQAKRRAASDRKAAMHDAMLLRDAIYTGMRNALGLRHDLLDELDGAVGNAESADNLATGMESLAALLDRYRKGKSELAPLLAEFNLGEAQAAELRQGAKKVRDADKKASSAAGSDRVDQRALDIQDGRTLSLMGLVLRSFREGSLRSPRILVPPLPRVGWLFRSRPRRASKGKGSPPDGTQGKPT